MAASIFPRSDGSRLDNPGPLTCRSRARGSGAKRPANGMSPWSPSSIFPICQSPRLKPKRRLALTWALIASLPTPMAAWSKTLDSSGKPNAGSSARERELSRKRKGSANRAKARRALARECEKVANRRADFAHKFSTSVVEENNTIACETLNLKGMSKTKLAKSVQDAAHRETFRRIEYKARWRNRNFVFIGRWFPSSQLCSNCGHRHQELSLSDRFWTCPACGVGHDRDHNAAKNVRDEGIRILVAVGHTET